jgi:hypothetical protein
VWLRYEQLAERGLNQQPERPMRHVLAVYLFTFVAACASGEDARFGDTHDVIVAERNESTPVVRDRSAAHFFIAFIVDTTGRVEKGSISFIGNAPEEWRGHFCNEYLEQRYRPVRREGVARRALMIHAFDTVDRGQTASLPTANMLFDSTRTAVFGRGVAAAVEQLETRPHC